MTITFPMNEELTINEKQVLLNNDGSFYVEGSPDTVEVEDNEKVYTVKKTIKYTCNPRLGYNG